MGCGKQKGTPKNCTKCDLYHCPQKWAVTGKEWLISSSFGWCACMLSRFSFFIVNALVDPSGIRGRMLEFNHVQHFTTLWIATRQAPLSVGFSQARIQDWVAIPSSRGSPYPGVEPKSPALEEDSSPLGHQGTPADAYSFNKVNFIELQNKEIKLRACKAFGQDYCDTLASKKNKAE